MPGALLDVPDVWVNVEKFTVANCPRGTNLIEGTLGDDVLVGTPGNDCILGYDGNDVISGGGGNDTIFGGFGDDTLHGGDGNDALYGEAGADTLLGELGKDKLRGGDGNDLLDGGDGKDDLRGENGDDTLLGGAGKDKLRGGNGNDRLEGGPGNDNLKGDNGDDVLLGGTGNDKLDGKAGLDTVNGGAGTDQCTGEIVTGCENIPNTQTCGNGVLEPGEVCDDGNTVSGDGCSADCLSLEVCGDGVVNPGEVCDDGNQIDTDGCTTTCRCSDLDPQKDECYEWVVVTSSYDPATGDYVQEYDCTVGGDIANTRTVGNDDGLGNGSFVETQTHRDGSVEVWTITYTIDATGTVQTFTGSNNLGETYAGTTTYAANGDQRADEVWTLRTGTYVYAVDYFADGTIAGTTTFDGACIPSSPDWTVVYNKALDGSQTWNGSGIDERLRSYTWSTVDSGAGTRDYTYTIEDPTTAVSPDETGSWTYNPDGSGTGS